MSKELPKLMSSDYSWLMCSMSIVLSKLFNRVNSRPRFTLGARGYYYFFFASEVSEQRGEATSTRERARNAARPRQRARLACLLNQRSD